MSFPLTVLAEFMNLKLVIALIDISGRSAFGVTMTDHLNVCLVSVATDECSSGESSSLTMDRPLNEKDTILITGQPLSCEAAKEAMLVAFHFTLQCFFIINRIDAAFVSFRNSVFANTENRTVGRHFMLKYVFSSFLCLPNTQQYPIYFF